MSLIAEIEDEIKDAIRGLEQLRADTLRLTLASLRSAEKELGRPLKEDEELQVLQRERKRRAEAAEAFRSRSGAPKPGAPSVHGGISPECALVASFGETMLTDLGVAGIDAV